MRIKGKMVLLVAIVALLMVPVLAQAEMYVEGYIGGTFGENTDMTATPNSRGNVGPFAINGTGTFHTHGRIDPSVIGGIKVGTWFVKEGFLGFNYPDWMKYFGFYLDFSYQKLDHRRQMSGWRGNATSTPPILGIANVGASGWGQFWTEGECPTLAFMFAARYGFLPDKDVPFGRLQPFVAAGPAIMFVHQKPTVQINRITHISINGVPVALPPTGIAPPGGLYKQTLGGDSSAEIALCVESGVRYMALKNVAIVASFKYRYCETSLNYDFANPLAGIPGVNMPRRINVDLDPEYNLFSFQIGAAYHF